MECSPISQAFFAFFTLFEIAIWADVVAWFLGILLVGSFALCWLFVSDTSTKVSIRGAPSASQSHPLIPYVQVSGTQILQGHRHRAFFVLFLHWNTRLCVLFLFLFLDSVPVPGSISRPATPSWRVLFSSWPFTTSEKGNTLDSDSGCYYFARIKNGRINNVRHGEAPKSEPAEAKEGQSENQKHTCLTFLFPSLVQARQFWWHTLFSCACTYAGREKSDAGSIRPLRQTWTSQV